MKISKIAILIIIGLIFLFPNVQAKEDINTSAESENCKGAGDTFRITITLTADEDGFYQINLTSRENIFEFVMPHSGGDKLEMVEGDSVEFYFDLIANDSIKEGKYIVEYSVFRDKKEVIDDGKVEVCVEKEKKESFIPGFEVGLFILAIILVTIIRRKKF